ncbi:BNR-4 repeat-containing protein [uncultured Aquimarina sp.]|uniref:BNR-4 repeat-containing protein n=1 Tax=uncultured Aquimarina sp. TaxID=575652 RepID=UPI00261D7702|nr:BNR-4 repeat-containing protein [uncultured Aquimarina sp.]
MNHLKPIIIVFSVLFICTNNFLIAQVSLEKHEELNQNALKFWYADPDQPAARFNRNISPKGDCLQFVNGYLFLTWYKGGMQNRNLMLSRLHLESNTWATIQFPDKVSLYSSGEGNSHRVASLGVSPIDGTIHLMYDMHASELRYRFSEKNIAFAPDSDFTLDKFSSRRNYFKPGNVISRFTYPNTEVNQNGELIVEYRLGTSRQGDKYIILYDGNSWSDTQLVMRGNNENPEFNQYGGFRYFFDQLYLGCSVRIKGDDVEFNKGFYYAAIGNNGLGDTWENLNGQNISTPIEGLTEMNKFKIADPLPNGSNGMTSAPNFVVSKNKAIHFTNRIPGQGTVHYYTKPNSDEVIKASGGSPPVNFPGDDGRVYSIEVKTNGKIQLRSTKEGESNWRTDYTWSGNEEFDQMVYEYANGYLHIIASEERNSDQLPLHYLKLKLESVDIPNELPMLSFVTPTEDIVLQEGYASFEVTVDASDIDGSISNVQLYIDDDFIRQEVNPPYTWGQGNLTDELLGLSVGEHTIKAIATDNDGGISEISFIFIVEQQILSIDEFEEVEQNVKIYPNPVKENKLNIIGLSQKNIILEVYDVFGKKVFTRSTSEESTILDLSELSAGLYVLHISSNVEQINKVFVKK